VIETAMEPLELSQTTSLEALPDSFKAVIYGAWLNGPPLGRTSPFYGATEMPDSFREAYEVREQAAADARASQPDLTGALTVKQMSKATGIAGRTILVRIKEAGITSLGKIGSSQAYPPDTLEQLGVTT
jgi:hypothetical protein